MTLSVRRQDGMESVMTEDAALPLFKKRGPKKSTIRKRAATPSDHSSESEHSTDDEQGRRVKRRRKGAGVLLASNVDSKVGPVNTSKNSQFVADRSADITITDDATKQSNWYEELSAKELLGTTRTRSNAPPVSVNYDVSALSQTKSKENESRQPKGPVKAPTNIRTITVTDYSPDVCKDYKQTGWCGFGDSCKFLHAREAYAQGWQLDKEWEQVTKGKKMAGTVTSRRNRGANEEADDDDDETMLKDIPFACIICKEDYKNPVVTRCGHYFCEPCALKRFKKTPACAQCGTGTGGVFNGAKNLKKILERKRDRERRAKERARENGEEVSDEEDEE